MAKIDLKFLDFLDNSWIKVQRKEEEAFDCISILVFHSESENYSTIYLDKSTAIKFAKTLRTEINKIDSEAYSG